MFRIQIIAVGLLAKKSPYQQLIDTYQQRLGWKLQWSCVEAKEKKQAVLKQTQENQLLREQEWPQSYVIGCDRRGKSLSSEAFAALIMDLQQQARPVSFVLGGADGLTAEYRQDMSMLLSFGSWIYPHALARLMLVEQLYRAYTISHHHPYHRE